MTARKYSILMIFIFCANVYAENITDSNKCDAISYQNSFAAGFPIVKKRALWEWYKKSHPEYIWSMELGFYKNGVFTSNGLGISISIGSMNLKSTPMQNGSLEDLIRFSTKNAFLTIDSKHYSNKIFREKVMYSSQIFAKKVEEDMIMIGTSDANLVELFNRKNPTHMKLKATLPESDESYTCYPKIERIL